MIYKIFVSCFDSVEEIYKHREMEKALDIRFNSDFQEIEANSLNEAKEIFADEFDDVVSDIMTTNSQWFNKNTADAYFLDENNFIRK
ncbi:MAG: hypothetical protein PUE75_02565 [Eubacteriales bacterium]|nr:hypothetical protein [Eubacteriales bacterium]